MKLPKHLTFFLLIFLFSSCMDDTLPITPFDLYGSRGVFIINEGNYLYGNASLSYYDIDTKEVINDIFTEANGIPLGDVANSMEIRDGKGYIVVNNSGCVHIIDLNTIELKGTIAGLTSPRYIHFLSDQKALVSDMYARGISIVNPEEKTINSFISTGSSSLPYYRHPTENLIQVDDEIFTNCWSYDSKILVIDIDSEMVVDSIEVGLQPYSMVLDKNEKIWVINDGGYSGNPVGNEAPSLMRINPTTRKVEKTFPLADNSVIGKLALNPNEDTLYYICDDIYRMNINSIEQATTPFVYQENRIFRSIGIDYKLGDIYAADATDFMSEGIIYRFNTQGEPLDTFSVGITPTCFCFN